MIAVPLDDATWREMNAVAKGGGSVGTIMDITQVDPDAKGGVQVIHSIGARAASPCEAGRLLISPYSGVTETS